ncbi:carbohydrate ABC transporter membrane protein 2 (CUT1 family) [Glaciihabitans tibetensis]|uniref:Carbohydrate ABC transporter membrane protein 2 (CUT1 family) n=1 Tax=Glaciihabitans tibetensis TaxID=1266600 RepID=A0A2T0V5H5_9MICO|nr:carbohydrate ABC transporter permease [Glaciihabitans tibetensis]PRY65420.1 carbohydrate ABC transporter membrane protein 2 (CUT1 family) [Glaciihabitans tibetensis]
MTTSALSQKTTATSGGSPRAARRPLRAVRAIPKVLVVALILAITVVPLIWLLLGSLKTQTEWLNNPSWALPENLLNFANYEIAWVDGNIGRYILNSALATFPSLALIVILGVAAGFALEVLVWRGRNGVLLLFLAGIMVPGQMILLPLFSAYFQTNLTGTIWPLILTYTATGLPLTVFMMATYFRAVPKEIFEAAAIDGASIYRSFLSIAFPMVRNAVFTVALVQFFFIWNDLLISLTFTSVGDFQTIQVGLLNFTGQFGQVQYGPMFAAICINVVGILVLYLFLNQRVMRGLTAGSVKG